MKKIVEKTVNLDLIGVNGNAFMIVGVFKKQAQKEGWSTAEIDAVIAVAKDGNYNHFLATIENHCEVHSENENIDPKEVWEVLQQLGHHTHYLATKTVEFWDEYDRSNYNSLRRKAGKDL